MAETTGIGWTDSTWTPIRAKVRPDAPDICRERGWTDLLPIVERTVGRLGPHCEKVSPGCAHCYSEANNGRCLPYNGTGLPFDKRSRALIDAVIDERILMQPLRWRKPRRIFVCSQTDLYGAWVPDHLIDRVSAMMAICEQHQFQIPTKRAERLPEYINGHQFGRMCDIAQAIDTGREKPDAAYPLSNVHLGVSVESADYLWRVEHLRKTPAAVRFLSLEPLLGPLGTLDLTGIHWAICGVESGPRRRPTNIDWIRSIRDQCSEAGVPFYLKQLEIGGRIVREPELDGRRHVEFPEVTR